VYDRFLKYINSENLFETTDKLLIGVSGGVDSVVLSNLIDRVGNQFALAHCNFNLRGEESDDDEQFVRSLAQQLGAVFFKTSFATRNVAEEQGISIEMAARNLRYNWFEEVRSQQGFDYVVVGHHLDDVLETFLLNLSRGTGIRGLSGIKPKTGKIVRPLLFALRSEIEEFAQNNQLQFRHDSSNDDTAIKRNLVRHQIMPLLESLNPQFKHNFERSIGYLKATEKVFLQAINEAKELVLSADGELVKVSKKELQQLDPQAIYLFEFLREYNFSSEVVDDILLAINKLSGKQFFSETHRLVIDREELLITPLKQDLFEMYYIERGTDEIQEPLHLRFTVEEVTDKIVFAKTELIALFDFDKIEFPLVLRKWKQGEYFRPLGMQGLKKVSDFFIDQKYSLPEKENSWILESADKVVWIVGKRIDDRFKVTSTTKKILKISYLV
jgi:tRNA(Ile)-lysidine synthase